MRRINQNALTRLDLIKADKEILIRTNTFTCMHGQMLACMLTYALPWTFRHTGLQTKIKIFWDCASRFASLTATQLVLEVNRFKLTLSFVNPRKVTVLPHIECQMSVSDREKLCFPFPFKQCFSQQTKLLNVTWQKQRMRDLGKPFRTFFVALPLVFYLLRKGWGPSAKLTGKPI